MQAGSYHSLVPSSFDLKVKRIKREVFGLRSSSLAIPFEDAVSISSSESKIVSEVVAPQPASKGPFPLFLRGTIRDLISEKTQTEAMHALVAYAVERLKRYSSMRETMLIAGSIEDFVDTGRTVSSNAESTCDGYLLLGDRKRSKCVAEWRKFQARLAQSLDLDLSSRREERVELGALVPYLTYLDGLPREGRNIVVVLTDHWNLLARERWPLKRDTLRTLIDASSPHWTSILPSLTRDALLLVTQVGELAHGLQFIGLRKLGSLILTHDSSPQALE
ncbi:hypothetical protein GMRT_10806 [Giardia muris]|uniref:Uncharacterized protein n=1 Tax=Giardia muris TaxID=5742 RepID=A0A4Z1T0S6_GIAMU|nr:hypothetical protein GMRT_10806 [Giardia muris]|eukprot:TNJ27503.1 hypothetical protein GMRT_10806 [Giardia muris]